MAQAGYSGTPLPQKLGIKEGSKVALVGPPAGFPDKTLGVLPTGAVIGKLASKAKELALFDVIVVFVKLKADLVVHIASCRPRMQQDGGLWIAWPKKASGVPTDITEQTIRDVALPTGLVDNKVCAIDETWSGLRLVIRRENRTRDLRT
ncbi:MAG: DUF3052 family protein [Myxococcales bacterium]|nr:DUF3052 family protein [Myxococcales bacterium]